MLYRNSNGNMIIYLHSNTIVEDKLGSGLEIKIVDIVLPSLLPQNPVFPS